MQLNNEDGLRALPSGGPTYIGWLTFGKFSYSGYWLETEFSCSSPQTFAIEASDGFFYNEGWICNLIA